ncbi:hypothetical protein JYU34_004349 [Plutella xylostella]|uniref:FLYWCH-type domain-containing protein n=1 Tax=Plutella xylostella TaxID=51655 RepID=A0ABQ7QXS4_PLUXY|nr:hypothetical protein JYU34_004349 [Plutella xylostella]
MHKENRDGTTLWYCSRRQAGGCRAHVKLHQDQHGVLDAQGDHDHEPPQYYRTRDGQFVRY